VEDDASVALSPPPQAASKAAATIDANAGAHAGFHRDDEVLTADPPWAVVRRDFWKRGTVQVDVGLSAWLTGA
jgi:hypothetical protein